MLNREILTGEIFYPPLLINGKEDRVSILQEEEKEEREQIGPDNDNKQKAIKNQDQSNDGLFDKAIKSGKKNQIIVFQENTTAKKQHVEISSSEEDESMGNVEEMVNSAEDNPSQIMSKQPFGSRQNTEGDDPMRESDPSIKDNSLESIPEIENGGGDSFQYHVPVRNINFHNELRNAQ